MDANKLKEITKSNILRKKQEAEEKDLSAAKAYIENIKSAFDSAMLTAANDGNNFIKINIPSTTICSRAAFTKALVEAYPEGSNKDQFKVTYKENRSYRLEDEWMEISW